jgi:hypothetical protein
MPKIDTVALVTTSKESVFVALQVSEQKQVLARFIWSRWPLLAALSTAAAADLTAGKFCFFV